MHYSLNDDTMEINNFARYKEQGQPDIGHYSHLSEGNIRLVNKMYKCYNQDGQCMGLSIYSCNKSDWATHWQVQCRNYCLWQEFYEEVYNKINYYQHAANTRGAIPIGKYNAEITAYGKNSMKKYTTK